MRKEIGCGQRSTSQGKSSKGAELAKIDQQLHLRRLSLTTMHNANFSSQSDYVRLLPAHNKKALGD